MTPQPMTLVFERGGTVRAVYDDRVAAALRKLGPLKVQRASHVEFDNTDQEWVVELLQPLDVKGEKIRGFETHALAIAWERAYVNARLAGAGHVKACVAAARVCEG